MSSKRKRMRSTIKTTTFVPNLKHSSGHVKYVLDCGHVTKRRGSRAVVRTTIICKECENNARVRFNPHGGALDDVPAYLDRE